MAKATEAIVMMKAMATTRTMIMTMIAAMATNMKKTTKKITVKNIINDFLINYSFKDFYDCLNKTSEILLLLFQRRRLFC